HGCCASRVRIATLAACSETHVSDSCLRLQRCGLVFTEPHPGGDGRRTVYRLRFTDEDRLLWQRLKDRSGKRDPNRSRKPDPNLRNRSGKPGEIGPKIGEQKWPNPLSLRSDAVRTEFITEQKDSGATDETERVEARRRRAIMTLAEVEQYLENCE